MFCDFTCFHMVTCHTGQMRVHWTYIRLNVITFNSNQRVLEYLCGDFITKKKNCQDYEQPFLGIVVQKH